MRLLGGYSASRQSAPGCCASQKSDVARRDNRKQRAQSTPKRRTEKFNSSTTRRFVIASPILLRGFFSSPAEAEAPPIQADASASIQRDYDGYSGVYDELDGGDAADLFGLPDLRKRILARAGGRVLEVGVGTGLNLPLYDWQTVESLDAIDLSSGMLDQARGKAEAVIAQEPSRRVVRLQQGSVTDLPYSSGTFDAVVDTFSLCVYPDPLKALEEMRRVTRPGGRVLLLAHSKSNIGPLGMYQDITAPAVTKMGRGCAWNQDLQKLLPAAGLRIVSEERHLAGLISLIEASPAA